MLHVFAGTDTIAVRTKALEALKNANPSGTSASISSDNFAAGMVKDALGANSLFGGNLTYLLDTPSQHDEFLLEVKELLSELAHSTHTFVVIEGALLAPEKKLWQKYADSFEYLEGEKGEKFNAFALSDALAARDKKSLWVVLQKAKLAGLPEEMIVGTLWWQLKSMLLATRTSSAAQAGVSAFVYEKSKRATRLYSVAEIEALAHSLLAVYHQGHSGETEFDLALEQWVLGV